MRTAASATVCARPRTEDEVAGERPEPALPVRLDHLRDGRAVAREPLEEREAGLCVRRGRVVEARGLELGSARHRCGHGAPSPR